jgi:hypothetical protein
MAYEIEFHPVGSGANSGDAITMRYWTGSEWRVIVIDAPGVPASGATPIRNCNDAAFLGRPWLAGPPGARGSLPVFPY